MDTIYRTTNDVAMPFIVSGEGSYLYSESEQRHYLDFSSGPGASSLGHSNKFIIDTMKKQLDRVPYVFSGVFRNQPAEYAGRLLRQEFDDLKEGWFGRAVFQGSGSEAVDLACRLAVQYQFLQGKKEVHKVAALSYGFHGVTSLPYALSDYYPRYGLMQDYDQRIKHTLTVRLPHPMFKSVEGALKETVEILHERKDVAAVIVEPVGGPASGAFAHHKAYLAGLQYLCEEFGVILIFDEIFCGSGRCGYLSCAHLYDVWPDIILLGKGITAGYQPMSIICLSNKLTEALRSKGGQISWGSTYGAHPMGCTAVSAFLKYVRSNRTFDKVRSGEQMLNNLIYKNLLLSCNVVTNVNLTGYLVGLVLNDPDTGGFLDPSFYFKQRVK